MKWFRQLEPIFWAVLAATFYATGDTMASAGFFIVAQLAVMNGHYNRLSEMMRFK